MVEVVANDDIEAGPGRHLEIAGGSGLQRLYFGAVADEVNGVVTNRFSTLSADL
jgi:hypothetical protein